MGQPHSNSLSRAGKTSSTVENVNATLNTHLSKVELQQKYTLHQEDGTSKPITTGKHSSRAASGNQLKSYDNSRRNTVDGKLPSSGPVLKELKMEPLRRKLNNTQNNRINELRRMGQQFTELPKIVEEEGAQSAL